MQTLDWQVTLTGTTDIMFDRYPGDNKTKLPPEQKIYMQKDGTVYLPSLNVLSFLAARNTESAPKMLLDSKEYKRVADALASCTSISPHQIPFLRNGKPVHFAGLQEQRDGSVVDRASGIYVAYHVARLEKGVPNPKERPVLPMPWTLQFRMIVSPHPQLNEELIEDLFVRGGQFLGLGSFRKVYGKFTFTRH